MTNTYQANKHAAIATGLAQATSPTVVANRAEARLRKAEADRQLSQVQATAPTKSDYDVMGQIQSNQLELQRQETQKLLAENARMRTYDGLQRYGADGNVNHLNLALQDLRRNTVGAKLFPNVARLDKVTADDKHLLGELGLSWEEFNTSPELISQFLKATDVQGNTTLTSFDGLAAATGYNKYRTQQELQDSMARSQIYKNYLTGKNKTEAKALDPYKDLTEDESIAYRQTQQERPEGVEEKDWKAGNSDFDKAMLEKQAANQKAQSMTARERYRQGVREAKTSINEIAGSADAFFDKPISGIKDRLKYEDYIQDIMSLGNLDIDTKTKSELHHIGEFVALNERAGDLSTEATGKLDSILINTKRYFEEDANLSEIESRSAYEALRNSVRHALYGASLTEGEKKAFEAQFGGLGSKLGPVLVQLENNLNQLIAKTESIMNLGDSYVSHFYVGKDLVELQRQQDALQERISYLKTLGGEPEEPGSPEDLGSREEPAGDIMADSELAEMLDALQLNDLESGDTEGNAL